MQNPAYGLPRILHLGISVNKALSGYEAVLNEELASVLAGKGSELLHLGLLRWAFRRGRQGALSRRLAGGVDELLKACWREDIQNLGWSRVDGVAVRDALGPKDERSRRGLYRLV